MTRQTWTATAATAASMLGALAACGSGETSGGSDGAAEGGGEGGNVPDGGADASGISASRYDQSCRSAADCVLAVVGDVCGPGCLACPSAAINMDSLAAYNADYRAAVAACATPPMLCPGHCLAEPDCVTGMCTVCPQGCADAASGDASGD